MAKVTITGSNVSANTYFKEGSNCKLQSEHYNDTTKSDDTQIKSIYPKSVKLNLIKPGYWFPGDKRIHTFNVICEFKRQSDNTTTTRQTRAIRGGGINDVELYGGGVTIVNSANLIVTEVRAKKTEFPMTYDVRAI